MFLSIVQPTPEFDAIGTGMKHDRGHSETPSDYTKRSKDIARKVILGQEDA